ncbi:MAG: 16S rRNA (cytosine(1402)-N(4))-methyltransferase RsmH [Planctomycetota bacterium]
MDEPSTEVSGDGRRGNGQPLHRPVLLREVVDLLALREGLVVVDGTVGAGGHARAIVPHIGPTGILVGLDRDSEILGPARAALAEATAAGAGPRISLHHCAHSRMHEALASIGQSRCDRVLLDLGVSSMQLDRPDRGFSFMADGPLDMRMDASAPDSAADWLAVVGERELADVIYQLGEERHSRRIARAICDARRRAPITRTGQLAEIVRGALPAAARHGRIHPATRTFQAIRMHVNDELGELRRGLDAARACLRPGGRLCVITFHSLEDRIVKHSLRAHFEGVTKPPVVGMPAEIAENPRARSAKLRCGIRLEDAA